MSVNCEGDHWVVRDDGVVVFEHADLRTVEEWMDRRENVGASPSWEADTVEVTAGYRRRML